MHLERRVDVRHKLGLVAGLISTLWFFDSESVEALQRPAFRAGVNLVRVGAVVRDRKGRFVRNLSVEDFEVLDDGKAVKIASFQTDVSDVSVALLIDVSGSMKERMAHARDSATQVLALLNRANDEAAVFTFDSRLDEVQPFTVGLQTLPKQLENVQPFGATSLYDAIAQTAERLMARGFSRRAVIVFTDGVDTSSALTAPQVSAIASAIDVPVFILGIVPAIDNPSADISTVTSASPVVGRLAQLASWTGGYTHMVSTPQERALAARAVLDELRQQYLMTFEASGRPGWHPLVVRTRDKDHIVRARSGYNAGQSRPIS
jgi:Ca-activated chloride channel family protein